MSLTRYHFSHQGHRLVLKEDDVIGVNDLCYVCNKPVVGTPTFGCDQTARASTTSSSSSDDDDEATDCETFYLHKSCAESPMDINHYKHKKHPLTLLPFPDKYSCYVCSRDLKFAYRCDACDFDLCLFCAFEQRELRHQGHKEHTLTLMRGKASFECDACRDTAADSSYICTTCDFLIHKTCAFSPFTIPAPTHHHHPLNLIFSIPDMHRYFSRYCEICLHQIHVIQWLYYCHKCTYFVHMRCAISSDTISVASEIETDGADDEPDMLEFPLHSERSMLEVIIAQFNKLQAEFQGRGGNNFSASTLPNEPDIIEDHWSHKNHPLEHLQFTISEKDDDDDTKELVCDGCNQPITVSHPSYYACIQCGFFLHSFCATRLPRELPVGASPFHPEHALFLHKSDIFFTFVICTACHYFTNGFYYECEDCDVKLGIRCAFLPIRIKHKSHKHHTLVRSTLSNQLCKVSKFMIRYGMGYTCETCSSFQMMAESRIYPSRVSHRFDIHPITLRYPPFFYEGVLYCEICEDRVNNQTWLYHCTKCDHSFHCNCLFSPANVKVGGTIQVSIQNEPHTLALTYETTQINEFPLYVCECCGEVRNDYFRFVCDGCGILVCCQCAAALLSGGQLTSS